MSGHEILFAVAVFCFAWQRRMSLGQGGVDWDGGEVLMGEREKGKKKSGFALCNPNSDGSGVMDRSKRAL